MALTIFRAYIVDQCNEDVKNVLLLTFCWLKYVTMLKPIRLKRTFP